MRLFNTVKPGQAFRERTKFEVLTDGNVDFIIRFLTRSPVDNCKTFVDFVFRFNNQLFGWRIELLQNKRRKFTVRVKKP